MYFIWLEILLCCVGALLQTSVSEKCNVTFHSKLKSRSECYTTYGACGFDNLQARFPKLYNKTGWRRDPPSNIKLSSFCELDSAGVNQSGLNIQWNLPNSYSAAGIAGYELRVEGDPPNFRCLVVILEEKASQENSHLVLNSTMFPVGRHYNYMIVLHSLPRANNSEPESKHIVSMNCKRGFSSRNWTPAGHNYTYKWPEKTLTVWFPPPPPEYNITTFQLDLQKDTELIRIKTNKTEVIFTDKEPGKYTLYMQPFNENPHDKDLCVCRDDEGTCKSCKLSVWHIDAQIPKKKLPATGSKGSHSAEIIVGVCVFVAIAIAIILLYKFVAKRYGIECVLGKNKLIETDILHVLCIDMNSNKEDVSKLQLILGNDLNTKVKFIRINAVSDTNITPEMTALWKKWKLSTTSATENLHQRPLIYSDNTVCKGKNKADDTFNLLICLMVTSFADDKLSEYLSKVRSSLPQTGQLQIQICAVTFTDTLVFPQCKMALKCYCLHKDKQDFVTAVQKAFPKYIRCQEASVLYKCKNTNSGETAKNGVKSDHGSGQYVALTKSQSCNDGKDTNGRNAVKETEKWSSCEPEVMFLGVSETRRERYVSNDSGRGGSELSYKQGQSPDDRSGLLEETASFPFEVGNPQCPQTGQNGVISKYHKRGTECPSCDISFFPPDPSVISENEYDPDTIDFDLDNSVSFKGYKGYADKRFPEKMCSNCLNGFTKSDANSLDSVMDKMAEINERSAIYFQQNSYPGEVHSVWEGHV